VLARIPRAELEAVERARQHVRRQRVEILQARLIELLEDLKVGVLSSAHAARSEVGFSGNANSAPRLSATTA
jgi:hypothetical protein